MNKFIEQLIDDGVSLETAQSEFDNIKHLDDEELLNVLADDYGMDASFLLCFK